MKLILVDMDGTLFDTKEVNFLAYRDAVRSFGYELDYDYFCKECNGRHYLDFLPAFTTNDPDIISRIHTIKKTLYKNYLAYARPNTLLIELLTLCSKSCKIALVTTASKNNTFDLLNQFKLVNLFDLILTGDEVKKRKPDPECYLKAMAFFDIEARECVAFEDSGAGIQAVERAGITCFAALGFN